MNIQRTEPTRMQSNSAPATSAHTVMGHIKVLVIEDSAVTRFILQSIINADTDLNVVGMTADRNLAEARIQEAEPDVIVLNLNVGQFDGLTFLRNLMTSTPLPVVVIAGNSAGERTAAIASLEYGAVDIVLKPVLTNLENLLRGSGSLCHTIKVAASASLKPLPFIAPFANVEGPFISCVETKISTRFYAIGSSTGGAGVLMEIVKSVQGNMAGCVVAQHMPPLFTRNFAERLNTVSKFAIKEAVNGDYIRDNQMLIIPGDCHGEIKRDSQGYFVYLNRDDKKNRQRPSVDLLFASAAGYAGENATGILLSGPGHDGAKGLLAMKHHGATTIAQNDESCMMFGMPKRAIELQAARLILSPAEIIGYINSRQV